MVAVPRITTSAMRLGHTQEVVPRLVRPPPVRAARATFFAEDALPIGIRRY
jgi:hypothetical protein